MSEKKKTSQISTMRENIKKELENTTFKERKEFLDKEKKKIIGQTSSMKNIKKIMSEQDLYEKDLDAKVNEELKRLEERKQGRDYYKKNKQVVDTEIENQKNAAREKKKETDEQYANMLLTDPLISTLRENIKKELRENIRKKLENNTFKKRKEFLEKEKVKLQDKRLSIENKKQIQQQLDLYETELEAKVIEDLDTKVIDELKRFEERNTYLPRDLKYTADNRNNSRNVYEEKQFEEEDKYDINDPFIDDNEDLEDVPTIPYVKVDHRTGYIYVRSQFCKTDLYLQDNMVQISQARAKLLWANGLKIRPDSLNKFDTLGYDEYYKLDDDAYQSKIYDTKEHFDSATRDYRHSSINDAETLQITNMGKIKWKRSHFKWETKIAIRQGDGEDMKDKIITYDLSQILPLYIQTSVEKLRKIRDRYSHILAGYCITRRENRSQSSCVYMYDAEDAKEETAFFLKEFFEYDQKPLTKSEDWDLFQKTNKVHDGEYIKHFGDPQDINSIIQKKLLNLHRKILEDCPENINNFDAMLFYELLFLETRGKSFHPTYLVNREKKELNFTNSFPGGIFLPHCYDNLVSQWESNWSYSLLHLFGQGVLSHELDWTEKDLKYELQYDLERYARSFDRISYGTGSTFKNQPYFRDLYVIGKGDDIKMRNGDEFYASKMKPSDLSNGFIRTRVKGYEKTLEQRDYIDEDFPESRLLQCSVCMKRRLVPNYYARFVQIGNFKRNSSDSIPEIWKYKNKHSNLSTNFEPWRCWYLHGWSCKDPSPQTFEHFYDKNVNEEEEADKDMKRMTSEEKKIMIDKYRLGRAIDVEELIRERYKEEHIEDNKQRKRMRIHELNDRGENSPYSHEETFHQLILNLHKSIQPDIALEDMMGFILAMNTGHPTFIKSIKGLKYRYEYLSFRLPDSYENINRKGENIKDTSRLNALSKLSEKNAQEIIEQGTLNRELKEHALNILQEGWHERLNYEKKVQYPRAGIIPKAPNNPTSTIKRIFLNGASRPYKVYREAKPIDFIKERPLKPLPLKISYQEGGYYERVDESYEETRAILNDVPVTIHLGGRGLPSLQSDTIPQMALAIEDGTAIDDNEDGYSLACDDSVDGESHISIPDSDTVSQSNRKSKLNQSKNSLSKKKLKIKKNSNKKK